MILDNAYTLKQLKQLTEALEALFLGSPDKNIMAENCVNADSFLGNVFGLDYAELQAKSAEDLLTLVEKQETKLHAPLYELLGNLFFQNYLKNSDSELGEKAKFLYQKYLETSGVFSLPIIQRINQIQ